MARSFNVALFFGVLGYLIHKPVGEFFVNRRKGIQEALALAEESNKKAKQRLDEISKTMDGLDDEVARILEDARRQAEEEKANIAKKAEAEAEQIVAQAKEDVESMRREAAHTLKVFITDLAMSEAEKVIQTSMTDADRNTLFVEFSERLEAKS
ncbi:F0F1 ATP synthase subunit B [Acanthopleuribacter pedis]|uniref:ATP synthase subunit b n=1 Tax=Acanthopleuribacter pedis TaxID=442870 RepID=A0A8J7U1Y6_9BACT|nr:F0F1 ATP synthase subunit B [Acanthopleuribacter pedis]MBO1317159.1 F0F1 ATP synthase subunit B [Acanthopleuribacter pedis]